MRFFAVILSAITFFFIYFSDQPKHYHLVTAWLSKTLDKVFFEKDIRVAGNLLLSSAEVASMLPSERSVLFWLFHRPVVETLLLKSPLIQSASISRCRWFSWGCFSVLIKEREPAFFAVIDNGGWVIGRDGGVIKPLALGKLLGYVSGNSAGGGEETRFISLASQLKIPVVLGLSPTDSSPDLVKGRFARLSKAMSVIQDLMQIPISYVEWTETRDMKVRFFGLNHVATFDLPTEELLTDSPGSLQDKARRLKKLLEEFGSKRDRIATVDLVFDKIAVVTTR